MFTKNNIQIKQLAKNIGSLFKEKYIQMPEPIQTGIKCNSNALLIIDWFEKDTIL